jgi:hypothetical protein
MYFQTAISLFNLSFCFHFVCGRNVLPEHFNRVEQFLIYQQNKTKQISWL